MQSWPANIVEQVWQGPALLGGHVDFSYKAEREMLFHSTWYDQVGAYDGVHTQVVSNTLPTYGPS